MVHRTSAPPAGDLSRRVILGAGLTLAAGGRAMAESTSPQPAVVSIRAADGRDVRLWVWSAQGRQRGVILFSHGAASSPDKYQSLLPVWAAAGFKILAPLHMDSTDHPRHEGLGLNDSWGGRLQDMRATAALCGADHYIVAGHSYGGLTALALGGAKALVPPGVAAPLRDPRAECVVAFSPPAPIPVLIPAEGYGGLAVPALIQTGDKDTPPGGGDWKQHLAAYDAAPAGDKYALVLKDVDHYFGNLICRPDLPGPPATQGLADATRISLDFIQAYGARDVAARRRLVSALTQDGRAKLSRK
jgi:pimeloyl-ACP methyl ester carboxylesterase